MSTKVCPRCSTEKPLSEFPIQKPGGRHKEPRPKTYCRPCWNALSRENRAKRTPEQREAENQRLRDWKARTGYRNPNTYNKAAMMKYLYGLSLEELEAMYETQNHTCAMTGCDNPAKNVDHDHDTGKVRALLCVSCNLRLGVLENPVFVERAIEYLRLHGSALPVLPTLVAP